MGNVEAAPGQGEITELLLRWNEGNSAGLHQLIPAVQKELTRIAAHHMRRERHPHTLETKALVNEAYLRLVDSKKVSWRNRAHFFGIAARLMRQILIDHARKSNRLKRGGTEKNIALNEQLAFSLEAPSSLLALDEALDRLAVFDERKARTVELRFFGGLEVEEAAEVLNVSPNTIIRDWSLAKAWLRRELTQ